MDPTSTYTRSKRIGLLGGTFDPVHVGHLVLAQEVCSKLELAEVIFVPAADPPHKPDKPVSPAYHRMAMLELAVAGNLRFTVSRFDVDRPGPHYTVDLLRLARKSLGDEVDLRFLMGTDSLLDLPTWHRPEEIISLARLVAVERPGYEADLRAVETQVPGLAENLDLVAMPLIGISATDLRRRVRHGQPIRYQVPGPVEDYIRSYRLYFRGDSSSPLPTPAG